MRELILEVIFVEKLGDAVLDDGVAEDLVDVWALVRVDAEHALEEMRDILTEMAWYFSVITNNNFPSQLMQTLRVERGLQRAHFVEKHAKRPYIGLEAVGLRLDYFRRQVVGRAHDCLGL